MTKVSVVMTVYNAAEYLREAVESVRSQTFGNWELIVMDDGSTDPMVQSTLGDYAGDSRIWVERAEPTLEERAATARYATLINWAVRNLSQGEYLTYLCGDDFYYPDRLERMVNLLDKGLVSVVYGTQYLLGEDGAGIGYRHATYLLTNAFHQVDLNSVMHTRESFDAAGGFPDDPSMWRDADAHFWNRLTDLGLVFHPVPGQPTDCKRYRAQSVDARCIRQETPWENG